jgi:hypothetical protein
MKKCDFAGIKLRSWHVPCALVSLCFLILFIHFPAHAASPRLTSKDHYTAGVEALAKGDHGAAVLALQRALAINPDLGAARAALAEAYMNLGDAAAAARLYNQVAASPQTPESLRPSFAAAATTLDTALRGGKAQTSYQLSLGMGYDSNANAAQADDQITIPALAALGPANLSDDAQAQSSVFQNAELLVQDFTPYSLAFSTFSSAQLSLRRNNNKDVSALNGLAVDYGLQYRTAENGTFALVAQAQQNLLGRSSYRRAGTLAGQWQNNIAPRTVLSLNTSYGLSTYTAENRDMTRFVLGSQLLHQLDMRFAPRLTLGVYAGRESATENRFNYQSYNFRGMNIGVDVAWRDDLSSAVSTSYETRDYSDNYPLFLTPRDEHEFNATTRTVYRITSQWSVEPQVRYTKAQSDVSLFTYDRTVAQINLRWRF